MRTLEEDFRIFAVLKFETGSNDYVEQRTSLERAAWWVIDSLCAAGFYSPVFTFPGWAQESDMGNFAIIHPVFPIPITHMGIVLYVFAILFGFLVVLTGIADDKTEPLYMDRSNHISSDHCQYFLPEIKRAPPDLERK